MIGIPMAVVGVVMLCWKDVGWEWGIGAFVLGYVLQWIGHLAEGNDVGEWAAIKRMLGLPYVGIAPQYETNPALKPRDRTSLAACARDLLPARGGAAVRRQGDRVPHRQGSPRDHDIALIEIIADAAEGGEAVGIDPERDGRQLWIESVHHLRNCEPGAARVRGLAARQSHRLHGHGRTTSARSCQAAQHAQQ